MTASSSNPQPEATERPATNPQPGKDPTDGLLLKRCPKCEYRLTGLPAESRRCPECGFEYDEFSRCWEDSNPWSFKKMIGAWTTGILFFVFLWSWISLFRLLRAAELIAQSLPPDLRVPLPTWPLLMMMAVFVAVMGVESCLLWRAAYRRSFVATTPRGIVFRLGKPKIRTVPWHKVTRVTFNQMARPISAQLKVRGSRWFASPIGFWWALKSSKEVREFAQAVEDGKRRYGSEAD